MSSTRTACFLQRLITGSQLAAPWGIALAPAGFGKFGGDLLVGNFSFASSVINAFDPLTGAFQGSIPIDVGAGNTAGGLWGLMFGSGAGNGGDANTLYFLDGINGETAGLFGAVAAVPEPEIFALLGVGLAAIGWSAQAQGRAGAKGRVQTLGSLAEDIADRHPGVAVAVGA